MPREKKLTSDEILQNNKKEMHNRNVEFLDYISQKLFWTHTYSKYWSRSVIVDFRVYLKYHAWDAVINKHNYTLDFTRFDYGYATYDAHTRNQSTTRPSKVKDDLSRFLVNIDYVIKLTDADTHAAQTIPFRVVFGVGTDEPDDVEIEDIVIRPAIQDSLSEKFKHDLFNILYDKFLYKTQSKPITTL